MATAAKAFDIMGINTAVFEGVVRGAPALGKLDDGRSIARYVVVGNSFRRSAESGYERIAAPVNVVTLGRQADRDGAHLTDGDIVVVHGQIVSWEEQDGRLSTVVEANSVSLIRPPARAAGTAGAVRREAAAAPAPGAAASRDGARALTPEHAKWLEDYGHDAI